MENNSLSVGVRMYRVGELGDCFLLRFSSNGNDTRILIDSGSFRNSKESVSRMKQIWSHIDQELGGKPLDVVVGTHQHNDHMSGFVHGEETFRRLGAKEVWLSWLDDPKDSAARVIRSEQEKAISRIAELGKRLSDSGFKQLDVAEKVTSILGFSDPVVPAQGLRILKSTGRLTRYLDPGTIVPLPGLEEEVRVFVLGPPKDNEKLKDIRPSSGESYDPHLAAAGAQAGKMLSAFNNFDEDADKWEEEHFPFTRHYKIPLDEFKKLAEEYKESVDAKGEKRKKKKEAHNKKEKCIPVWGAYYDESYEWRNIDNDWLEEASNLALYMDRYTNNTSLVLAFHLVKAGKFLLFVGDAQTGNWNSWKDIKWPNQHERFSINDLLNNTILYKVGHHCSHNATAVEALEAMTDESLVAMIPVDHNDPNITKKKGWKMPAKNLYKRLKERTGNRVMRMDIGVIDEGQPQIRNKNQFWPNLQHDHQLVDTDLYVEYIFMPGKPLTT